MTLRDVVEMWEENHNNIGYLADADIDKRLNRYELWDYIYAEYYSMRPIEQNSETFHYRVLMFFKMYKGNINNLLDTLDYKYKPLDNYHFQEDRDYGRGQQIDRNSEHNLEEDTKGTAHEEFTGEEHNTGTSKDVYSEDTSSSTVEHEEESGKEVRDKDTTLSTTGEEHETGSTTSNESGTSKETIKRTGNEGTDVTTSENGTSNDVTDKSGNENINTTIATTDNTTRNETGEDIHYVSAYNQVTFTQDTDVETSRDTTNKDITNNEQINTTDTKKRDWSEDGTVNGTTTKSGTENIDKDYTEDITNNGENSNTADGTNKRDTTTSGNNTGTEDTTIDTTTSRDANSTGTGSEDSTRDITSKSDTDRLVRVDKNNTENHKLGESETAGEHLQEVQDETIIRSGNIGKTYQSIIEEERKKAQFNIYRWIMRRFCKELMVGLW